MAAKSSVQSLRSEHWRNFFEASPTIRLLRSDGAPFLLDFFHRTFKVGQALSIGQLDLRTSLSTYLEEVHEYLPSVLTASPDRYLAQWVDQGWLQRFLEASSAEPQYQLSRHSEQALHFVDSAMSRGRSLVGTEGRLRMIFETLEGIVRGANADPERRLSHVRKQREAIDAEIREIEAGKSVQVFRPSQIRERFLTAVQLLSDLQSDFRAVEERFLEIARDVQSKQSASELSRGGILGYALDAEDLLKQQDEGVSFFGFVAFILSPGQQAFLQKSIEELQRMEALKDQDEAMQRLRRMVPALLAEADKVTRTTHRLSSTLRRLLDAQASEQRFRLASVLKDIRCAAVQLAQQGVQPPAGIDIEGDADVHAPMSRAFWTTPSAFSTETPTEFAVDMAQARGIAATLNGFSRLDFRSLRRRIREWTLEGESASLREIVETGQADPSQDDLGLVDVLGLLQIAHDDKHTIEADTLESIRVPLSKDRNQYLRITLPRIVFQPKAITREVGTKPR